MSAEKRSVHTDALATLGTIIDESGARDAIHLAVEPVIDDCKLYPGQDVGINERGSYSYINIKKTVGIVDPFLKEPVHAGERFWLIVYPRQITSLRHVWAHPDFDKEPEETKVLELKNDVESDFHAAQKWIQDFAAGIPLDYNTLMEGADDWVGSQKKGSWGEYLSFGSLLDGESVPDEFWDHYEKVRNVKVEECHRGSFFSCSC